MNPNDLFSQETLDKMIGKEQEIPQSQQDTGDVRHHPSLSEEKDISSHAALTDKYGDLSRRGGPAEIPGSTPPQESEVKTMGQVPYQFAQQSQGQMGEEAPDMRVPAGIPLNPSEVMILDFMKQLMGNGQLGNAFCNQLVQMLCENVQFMTTLRSQVMQQLMQSSNMM